MPTRRPSIPTKFQPKFWDELDGRTSVAQVIRDRYARLREDAGGATSTQRDMLIQRAVFIGVCMETIEHEAAATGNFDAGSYTQMSNALLGLLKALGLEKRAKPTRDLKAYIAGAGGDA